MNDADEWGRPPQRLEQRLAIEPDGTVVARSGKVEYGQGIRAGFARSVAAELAVPVARVRVELGETERVPWDMGTFGSLSTATDGEVLRVAAALARRQLLERAGARWRLPVDSLHVRDGAVLAPDGRVLTYAELVAAEPLAGPLPEPSTLVAASIPEATPFRPEARAIVTGAAGYAADVRVPGLLYGHVLHPPRPGSRLRALDGATARALPGVLAVVVDGDFVGVVAQHDAQALAAAQMMTAQWDAPPAAGAPFEAVLRDDAGTDAALAAAARRVTAHYHMPPIAHATVCPSAAVADVRADRTDLYVATQRPFGLRDEVAGLLGLSPAQVHVHPQLMSGQFGRGNVGDAALDAVRLSRAVARPVRVQWTRAEEFALSPYRPPLEAWFEAALDADGTIVAWRQRVRTQPHTYGGADVPAEFLLMTAGRNALPPYRLGRARVQLEVAPAQGRSGAFRSLAAAPNVFAIESFVDELALAAREDPLQFRLRRLDDTRLRRVLETVRRRSGWDARRHAAGHGFGVACADYGGTRVAQVAEVVLEGERIRLERVWCAVDAGRLVHPDGARNQIEGGIQQAASWAVLEELTLHDGIAGAATWHDYPIARCPDAPHAIDVVFTGDATQAPTGIGEPGSVPTAAAIANAVCDAGGGRRRRLPLMATVRDRERAPSP
jgi:CO/xanthine dehydrogenase Mo-binding subunit